MIPKGLSIEEALVGFTSTKPRIPLRVGRRYGSWTVVSSCQWRRGSGTTTYLRCRCQCGREELVSRSNLTGGDSLKCLACSYHDRFQDRREKYKQSPMVRKVYKLYCSQGLNDTEIGEELGITRDRARWARKALGLPTVCTRSEQSTRINRWRWLYHNAAKEEALAMARACMKTKIKSDLPCSLSGVLD